MSLPARLFTIYFIIGLLMLVMVVATHGKERRGPMLDASDGTQLGAGLLIFVALLWPVWLVRRLLKSDTKK